jgi:DNA-binding FrmR family transcriptional regulator
MDDLTRKTVKQRLASASGHLKGIERMVDDDIYCIDVIKQVQAVQAALNKVNMSEQKQIFLCGKFHLRKRMSEEKQITCPCWA